MAEVLTFPRDAAIHEILAALERDGACVVSDLLSVDQHRRVLDELGPWIAATPDGRDDFTGHSTGRTGALVARSQACREMVTNPLVLELAERFLAPYTHRIQLHLTQVINLHPGQPKQAWHRDRLAWGGFLPAEIEPQFNTIWALTDFTAENGATRILPGSATWPEGRRATDDEKAQAVMSAGSVLLYTGSVVHAGGANHSDSDRTGVNITYCLGWLRTEENQYLSCPPDIARDLDHELQELLGYTVGDYALGYYSDPRRIVDGLTDILPPEHAIGRLPRPQAHSPFTGT